MSLQYKYVKSEQQKQKENFMQDLMNYLYQEKKKRNYLELVFLCIGTDRITGDCLGPLVGTKLHEKLEKYNIFNIQIYGTLKENINYTNIQETLNKIEKNHPKACIIVIDAALSKEENIGKIFIENKKMQLGKGLYKAKMEIGDISIKAVVGKDYKLSKYNFLGMQNISLNMVIGLANVVSEGIADVIKYI